MLSWKSAATIETLTKDELRAHSLRVAGEALASTRRESADYRPAPSREELDEILERSRAEYRAARAAEAAAEEEEAARRRRILNVPTRRTAIAFDGKRWREFDPDAELATPEQIAEREERLARKKAATRAAADEARKKALKEAEPTISVPGVRVRARDGVIVQP